MSENTEKVITDVEPVIEKEDQLKNLRTSAISLINEADGFLLFAFKDGQIDLGNGQKAIVPKSLIRESGATGGGKLSLAYIVEKAKALLQMENDARNAQQAALSA